jgi:predicted nucleic acid-binding protein
MVTTFIDTAAFLAIINVEDDNHPIAKNAWKDLLTDGAMFITSNYIIVESIALIQNRLGIRFVQKLSDEILPLVEIHWIEQGQHQEAFNHILAINRRNLSLVDCSSFSTMRRLDLHTVFTFDPHFREQGFHVIP